MKEYNMILNRSSGILLHITSLPSRFGIGDLGKSARNFIDFLKKSSQKYWQILPLGPTGFGDSPYQTFSAFAGNPLLIDPIQLIENGLLSNDDISESLSFPNDYVDYGVVIKYKDTLFRKAFSNFNMGHEIQKFSQKMSYWLDDYALFMAIKQHNSGAPWNIWLPSIKRHLPAAIEHYKKKLSYDINYYKFLQFIFFKQWKQLKEYANKQGIEIIGDIPIFVALDSADAWSKYHIFQLDQEHNPIAVAGVPPDFFSETGQLWGNPLYNWDNLKEMQYRWWIERFKINHQLYDIIRIDHFRGFSGYWSVPIKEKTAKNGKWESAPGIDFFESINNQMGDLPIIAEDLGIITNDVVELRDKFNFPGMKILQFAFGSGDDNAFLPHNYPENCVVYTGTHDNATTEGWFKSAAKNEINHLLSYLEKEDSPISWQLIQLAWKSKAALAIAPLQDLLGLDDKARMNTPSIAGGNWQWRFTNNDLNYDLAKRLRNLTWECER